MEISNWRLLLLLSITLVGGLISEIHGKCTITPLREDRTIAYVCVNGNLSDVEEIPDVAEWIEFTVSRINYLPPDAFSRFHNLRRLTFYNCDLRHISHEAFRGLNNLEWLVMSNTKISFARAAQFHYLKNLRRLTLDGAGLVYIEPEIFHAFTKLETLSLRDNDLDCLPIDALGAMRNLKTVQIGKNPWLCDCRMSLGKFFEERTIEHGPGDEGECISRNDTYEHKMRGEWTRKRVYDCMTNLEYPELPRIGTGDEDHKPHAGGPFEWRVIANASIDSLEGLPDEISWIQLFDVPMPIIKRYAFFRFGNTLRSIELKNCGIQVIERESFAGLHTLERLSLIGNRFVNLGHEWFRDLGRLTDLVLRHNEIERFDENALLHLRALRHLDISGNRLKCLPPDYIRGLVSLQRLEAMDNPWLCHCKKDLEDYLTRTRIGYGMNSGRCELSGQSMSSWGTQYHNQTSWSTSTTSGTIVWSWTYRVDRPDKPTMIHPESVRPPVIVSTTSIPITRPGGCHLVRQSSSHQHEGRIESCLCTRSSLVDLIDVPDTLEIIVYHGSIIPTIHNDAFRKFGRYLKRLELSECGIQSIEHRAFYNLRILETLVIRGNDLDVVRSEWFDDTRNLRRLDISRNGITRISNGVFDRLPYLIGLDISDNHLNCIGIEHLESLRYLRELEITENPWTCLCITRLVQVMREREISCKCNPEALLRTREGGWGCNGDTNVDYPGASVIQPVSTTPQTKKPSWPYFPGPPTITDQPPVLPTWQTNGTCYQSHENVRGGGQPWYHCANGDISILFKIPSYVTKIEIVDSYVPRLTAMAFARFENLTELILRNCTLRDIDVQAFDGLYRLEKLTLRYNRFTVVYNGWFRHTRNLVRLDMSDNYLTEIEIGAFDGLERLEYLNLEGNAFHCIYTSCFVGLPRLVTLEFSRNPFKWRCWTELRSFLEIRMIGYTYHKCPHNGKDIVNNLLKDPTNQQSRLSNGGGSTSVVIHFTIISMLIVLSNIRLCVI